MYTGFENTEVRQIISSYDDCNEQDDDNSDEYNNEDRAYDAYIDDNL